MVRYPHTANITIETGSIVNGAWVDEGSVIVEGVVGRFEYKSNRIVTGQDKNRHELTGVYYTKKEPIENATELTVNERTYQIIDWIKNQLYCEILLK